MDQLLPAANPVTAETSDAEPSTRQVALSQRWRFGLRARATWALALGAMVISIGVASVTFLVARSSFLEVRRNAVERQAVNNAIDAQAALGGRGAGISSVLALQDRPGSSGTLVIQGGAVYVSGDGVSNDDIPGALAKALKSGTTAAAMMVEGSDGTDLVVGIDLPSVSAQFYEIASLSDLESKLDQLGRSLAFVVILASAGAALVGRGVARRVLLPLHEVATAAGGIASGHLDTRLSLSVDPDLDPLLTSFNEMAESLQQRLEREARFASDVSHELRTPLTALSTAAQLLNGRRDELGERGQRALDVLVTQTAHFERLVLDLLEISRFDAGAAELHTEVLDLPALIRQVVQLNGSSAQVVADGLDDDEVSVDKRRVERVVANLLQNAANYAGGATRVAIEEAEPADSGHRRIRILVDDEGPGVPEEEHEAIFERFRRGQTQLRSSAGPKGTGLGLALVAAHVRLHGGTVHVEDAPGGGARFVVELEAGA